MPSYLATEKQMALGRVPAEQESKADRHEVEWAKPSDLSLDPKNPRLPKVLKDTSQPGLLSTLATEYELTELGRSIADHGYFSEEPLVAVREGTQLIVVEGNRRLAALKLLDNPQVAPRAHQKQWVEIASSRKVEVKEVPILIYKERGEVAPFLGYRHITGVLPWRPYQKARYIAGLVEQGQLSFAEIARTIGSKTPTVREHYVTFTVLRQAEQFKIDTTGALDTFGVLRRALVNPNIRTFIGLNIDAGEAQLRDPIPLNSKDRLRELFSFLFGGEGGLAVIGESRDITNLGLVLSKAETIGALRSTRNLEEAFRLAGGEEQLVIDVLDRVEGLLREGSALISRHKDSRPVLRAVSRVRKAYELFDTIVPLETSIR
jgi:hypothetical protein